MAILLKPTPTDSMLFCCSKWWGNPDLPPQVEYPMYEGYPLTFICQIDCADIAPLDPEGKLPHEGMLYFFAALDDFLGYESPTPMQAGTFPKGSVVVKYSKSINMETFNSCILVGEDDEELAEAEMAIEFSECAPDERGIKLLGRPFHDEVAEQFPDCTNLLELCSDTALQIDFPGSGIFNFLIKESDLHFGNWKRSFGNLHTL